MPAVQPPCPRCQTNLFVRVEWVISGRRVDYAYYCGRCEHEWHVNSTPPVREVERRRIERRMNTIGELRPRRDHRRVS